MDVERDIDGVAVRGRLEQEGAAQRVQLIAPHGQLSLSFSADTDASDDGVESRAGALLDQLYHIASYAYDNQPMLRDILDRVIQRIESLYAAADDDQDRTEAESAASITQREIGRFFATAFPMPVPSECWEQVLRMIATPR